MANLVFKNAKILLEGRDMSGELNTVELAYSSETPEKTTFGDSSRRRLPGVLDVSASMNGYWDHVGASDSLDKDLFDRIAAASGLVSMSPTGTLGDPGFSFKAQAAEYTPGASHGEVLAFTLTMNGDGPLIRGTVMENSAFIADADGTGRELGAAAATDTLYSFLHVVAASGSTPTLDVVVESDDAADFVGATTELTHPQFTAVGADLQTKVGAITNAFYRLVVTITGGSPSFTIFGVIGIQQTLTP